MIGLGSDKNGIKLSHLLMVRAEGLNPPPPLAVSLTLIGPFFADSLSPNQNQNIRISNMNFGTYFDQTCTLGTSDLFYPPVK